MQAILGNQELTKYFHEFGKELSLVEPRSLEDIYKSHLENSSKPYADAFCNIR